VFVPPVSRRYAVKRASGQPDGATRAGGRARFQAETRSQWRRSRSNRKRARQRSTHTTADSRARRYKPLHPAGGQKGRGGEGRVLHRPPVSPDAVSRPVGGRLTVVGVPRRRWGMDVRPRPARLLHRKGDGSSRDQPGTGARNRRGEGYRSGCPSRGSRDVSATRSVSGRRATRRNPARGRRLARSCSRTRAARRRLLAAPISARSCSPTGAATPAYTHEHGDEAGSTLAARSADIVRDAVL